MILNRVLFGLGLLAVAAIGLTSCFHTEDPGPLQGAEKQFSIVDFDRLEMGSAFIIRVEQGNFFSVTAEGDRRNLDDLKVYKEGNTLIVSFSGNSRRKHETRITISMPVLRSAIFSGASQSIVSGFSAGDEFDFYLSGASISQLQVSAPKMKVVLSGASNLTLLGAGTDLKAEVSGASILSAFNYDADKAFVNASGASKASVLASDELRAVASGASVIYFRGDPSVISDVSGSSSVIKD